MALSAGTRLGPYEILAPLGAGGMGEVYWATDTQLGREVAIKTLPAALSEEGTLVYVPGSTKAGEKVLVWVDREGGEHEDALNWLERAYQDRKGRMPFLLVEPRLDPLREEPRFQDLLRRMNLRE
jgi:serine/threonine protein kinase